jgi:hypothetical protein
MPVGPREWDEKGIQVERPNIAFRQAIGVDLSYSEARGDYAAIIPVADIGGIYYVRHVYRFRRDILHARRYLAEARRIFVGDMVSYISGAERAVLQQLALEAKDRDGRVYAPVYIAGMIAKGDIVLRAQRTAELWQEGMIRLPKERLEWVRTLEEELQGFVNSGSRNDQLSALISAVDYLEVGRASSNVEMGTLRRTRT